MKFVTPPFMGRVMEVPPVRNASGRASGGVTVATKSTV